MKKPHSVSSQAGDLHLHLIGIIVLVAVIGFIGGNTFILQ